MRTCRLVPPLHALSRALATLLVFAATALVVAPSSSAQTTPLNLAAYHLAFTSISCTDPTNPFVCDVTATADVRSNLSTTPGVVTYTLVVDFSPSFDAPCNVVDETVAFTFDTGTITVHSYHQDCPATILPGPRIDTEFTVTGGTGAFAGAIGSGIERSGSGGPAAIVYHGMVTF